MTRPYKAATRRWKSPSLVHQPDRGADEPGARELAHDDARLVEPRHDGAGRITVGPPGDERPAPVRDDDVRTRIPKELPGSASAVASARSNLQSGAASRAAHEPRHLGRRHPRRLEAARAGPGVERAVGVGAALQAGRPRGAKLLGVCHDERVRRLGPRATSGPRSRKSSPRPSAGIAPTDCAPSTRIGEVGPVAEFAHGKHLPRRPQHVTAPAGASSA